MLVIWIRTYSAFPSPVILFRQPWESLPATTRRARGACIHHRRVARRRVGPPDSRPQSGMSSARGDGCDLGRPLVGARPNFLANDCHDPGSPAFSAEALTPPLSISKGSDHSILVQTRAHFATGRRTSSQVACFFAVLVQDSAAGVVWWLGRLGFTLISERNL